MRRAIVIGGGVVGLSGAIRLAERGWRVTLFDADGTRRAASWGNAGHIAVEQVAPLASRAMLRAMPKRHFAAGGPVDLPLRAIRHWLPFGLRLIAASAPARFAAGSAALGGLLAAAMPSWRRLAADIGDPALLREDGHLIAWDTPATAAAGRAAWMAADTGTATVADADDGDRALLATLCALPAAGAVRVRGSGQIADPNRLADALEAAFVERGGTIIRAAATLALANATALVNGVGADLIVVAAGIGSRGPMTALGHRVPMIAERGYHIRGSVGGGTDPWPADCPPIVFEDRSMIVTRYADRVQAAGFVEFGTADAPPDPRKWDRLAAHVRQLGLPLTGPFERWMGARPTLPDYLPAIGRSRRAANVIYAFGHQHLGLTLAPITAEIVLALAEGADARAAPFDIERFAPRKERA